MEPKRETWWSHRRAGSRQVDQPRSPTALKGARPRRSGIGLLAGARRTVFGYAIARATRDNSPCALNGAGNSPVRDSSLCANKKIYHRHGRDGVNEFTRQTVPLPMYTKALDRRERHGWRFRLASRGTFEVELAAMPTLLSDR